MRASNMRAATDRDECLVPIRKPAAVRKSPCGDRVGAGANWRTLYGSLRKFTQLGCTGIGFDRKPGDAARSLAPSAEVG